MEVEAPRYSVPHALVGLALEVRITRHTIEILHRGQRVASHAKSSRRGGFTTLSTHMPATHRAHREWTPQRLIHWGQSIGLSTGLAVTQLLEAYKHPEHGYRACLGLLSLAKRYGKPRLETACELALQLGVCKYRHVREILKNKRDQQQRQTATPEWVSPEHAYLRCADYYH